MISLNGKVAIVTGSSRGNSRGIAIAVKANVASSSDMTALFDAAINQYDKVDILVNNAGINIYKLVKDTTEEDFDRTFKSTSKAFF